ncbi:MAG: GntR family transcriptional regulator [Candidatus Eremiobacteraeota bacterium]|nr:GntR family transcriptional regulator [Candidatus Eremiobacteraeota bacterium]
MARSDATIAIDPRLDTPPHAQIFEQIRASIERGDLSAGAVMPTVRQLAGDLGIAPNTVARAYADLKAEGWIAGEERRPTRVASRIPGLAKHLRRRVLANAVRDFVATLRARGYAADEIARELTSRLTAVDA